MTKIASFDPFDDRIARDIRNSLATVFIQSLEAGCYDDLRSKAQSLLSISKSVQHKEYIANRLKSYEAAWGAISDGEITDPMTRALILWDTRLFFEVHELLEKEWLKSKGDRKKALQGFIRAAGMYVHLEQENLIGAQRMADKAIEALNQFGDQLMIQGIDSLLACLVHLTPVPPKLYRKKM